MQPNLVWRKNTASCERLSALSSAILHISASPDADTVLAEVVRGARAFSGARRATESSSIRVAAVCEDAHVVVPVSDEGRGREGRVRSDQSVLAAAGAGVPAIGVRGIAQRAGAAYDGRNPLPPTYCYLKPWYLPVELGYFEAVDEGKL